MRGITILQGADARGRKGSAPYLEVVGESLRAIVLIGKLHRLDEVRYFYLIERGSLCHSR